MMGKNTNYSGQTVMFSDTEVDWRAALRVMKKYLGNGIDIRAEDFPPGRPQIGAHLLVFSKKRKRGQIFILDK